MLLAARGLGVGQMSSQTSPQRSCMSDMGPRHHTARQLGVHGFMVDEYTPKICRHLTSFAKRIKPLVESPQQHYDLTRVSLTPQSHD